MTRLIWDQGEYRIIEQLDETSTYSDLAGDSYCPIANPDIDKAQLDKERLAFEREVDEMGVYGYALERWNPEVGQGWEHVESCWGFVGPYDAENERYNHYIVEELKGRVES